MVLCVERYSLMGWTPPWIEEGEVKWVSKFKIKFILNGHEYKKNIMNSVIEYEIKHANIIKIGI